MNSIEHFYYGQLVHHGSPIGDARVLARSKGVTEEVIQIALQALTPATAPNAPQLSWGVVRGNRDVPYIIAHAQQTVVGNTLVHYILLNAEVPRVLQGNIRAYAPLIEAKMQVFEKLADELLPLSIQVGVQPLNKQIDDLLELMSLTRNNTKTLEPLLSAIVMGQTLVVSNAPENVKNRMQFVQGLLTLLPSSTRFGVTFLLYSDNVEDNAQIIFSNAALTERQVGYDWLTNAVTNGTLNDYARFIVSQLRLDTEVAVQQAEALTQTAGWRFRNGDKLAEALDYASKRSKVDQAVNNGLPISMEDVSRILADDPTLSDEQRLAYAHHLVNFALALDDISQTEPVAILCGKEPALAKSMYKQFREAMENGKATLIFRMLTQWLSNPLAPQGNEWVELLNKAALLDLRDIVNSKDVQGLKDYLTEIQSFPERGVIQRILPKVVEVSVPFAGEDAELPTILMLLAMGSLDRTKFQQLLAQPQFVRYLPKDIKRFLSILNTKSAAQDNALMAAAASVSEDHRDEAIMQFADMAYTQERFDLMDTPVLGEIARIGATPLGKPFINTTLNIARTISDDHLKKLKQPAPRYILKMFANSHRYDLLLKAMAEQSRDIYGGERQSEYVQMLQEVFAEIYLPPTDLKRMLEAIKEHGIKDIPFICIIGGVLEASAYSAVLQEYADYATRELAANPPYCDVIHFEAPLALLKYYLENRLGNGVNQVAQLMPRVTSTKEDKFSLLGIRETYKALAAHEKLQALAFETLRQYARVAPPKPAQRIVEYYSKELGRDAASKLQRAYDFSLFTDRLPLIEYAFAVEDTANLIENAMGAYLREKPTSAQVQMFFETLRVRVDANTREKMATEVINFARYLMLLIKQNDKPHTSETINALANGKENPRTILDIFRVGGGKLLRGRVLTVKPKVSAASTPFGEIQTQALYGTLIMANAVLRQPFVVYPANKAITWTAALINDELDSMLKMLPADIAQDMAMRLGTGWQRLAELIPMLLRDTEPTILEPDNKTGRKLDNLSQQPKNPLEFFRYLHALLQ